MKKLILFSFVLGCTLIFACKNEQKNTASSTETSSESGDPKNLNEAMDQAKKAMEGLQNGKTVEPVNFRELKALLPDKVGGLPQVNSEGQTTGVMGMNFSNAEGSYRNEDGSKEIEVQIADFGGVGPAMMGMAYWVNIDVDNESSDGFERTGTFQGHKSFEKFNTGSNSGEIAVMVSKRFIVTMRGSGMSFEDLRKAVSSIDLGDLEDLGN